MADADLSSEIWKPIPFAPNYAASSLGRIKRLTDGTGLSRAKAGHILRPSARGHKRGYWGLTLMVDGIRLSINVHLAVAAAFYGDRRKEGFLIAHNDGNGRNNHVSNLRWCSQSENLADRLRHDTHDRGTRNVQAKLTDDCVRAIRQSQESERVLSARFNVSQGTIGKIRRRERWAHLP